MTITPSASSTPRHPRRSGRPTGAVAVIASAGGITALRSLLHSVPDSFSLPIFIAQHLAPNSASILDAILAWHSNLSVSWAAEGDQPGQGVYLVPPGKRLAVTAAGFELSSLGLRASSWLECGDHLIKSLVALYGSRTIGIVLSGALPAGVSGLRAIRACGGFAMAQDRISSNNFAMPAAAIDWGKADIVLPPERMAIALNIIAESRVH